MLKYGYSNFGFKICIRPISIFMPSIMLSYLLQGMQAKFKGGVWWASGGATVVSGGVTSSVGATLRLVLPPCVWCCHPCLVLPSHMVAPLHLVASPWRLVVPI